jgi:peptidoglycan hydrolase-like protein with peptidoglycan-binding domain
VTRRRTVIGLLAAGAVAAGTGAGLRAAQASGGDEDDSTGAGTYPTAAIVRGDLAGSTATSGTLRFADEQKVQSAQDGIVTALPAAGSVVTVGRQLYAVDNVSVFLLRGSKPAWRDLTIGMDDGPDVKQLEVNLRSLGYLHRTPDRKFTWATATAIEKWQNARGLERTGRLPLGAVVFTRADLRIGTVTAQVGGRASTGTELFAATSTTQIVEANLKLADQKLAAAGAKVSLRLPDGAKTTGRISSIGTPAEKQGASGNREMVIPVEITLDHPAVAKDFQEASVTVSIPSAIRKNVLSVPVSALLAIDPQGFGVEVAGGDGTTRRVPVTAGLFAAGRVEISGPGIQAGQRVVVPRR